MNAWREGRYGEVLVGIQHGFGKRDEEWQQHSRQENPRQHGGGSEGFFAETGRHESYHIRSRYEEGKCNCQDQECRERDDGRRGPLGAFIVSFGDGFANTGRKVVDTGPDKNAMTEVIFSAATLASISPVAPKNIANICSRVNPRILDRTLRSITTKAAWKILLVDKSIPLLSVRWQVLELLREGLDSSFDMENVSPFYVRDEMKLLVPVSRGVGE